MEHHGENPQKSVYAIIPARYSSVRLPGKMLLPIAGKPLILHTVERAREAETVDEVIVATDDQRIFDAVSAAGYRAVMTSPDHQSGSDRIAEVAATLPENSIIVNVQGDEPVISPKTIDAAVRAMRGGNASENERGDDPVQSPKSDAQGPGRRRDFGLWRSDLGPNSPIATLPNGRVSASVPDIVTTYEPIDSVEELENPNIVKIVATDEGRALYFSRSPMPFPREAMLKYGGPQQALNEEPHLFANYKKHTGLYVYPREFLLEFTRMPQTTLEKFEMLEQLRALENGAHIKVVKSASKSIGVDTQEDFERTKDLIEAGIDLRMMRRSDLPRVATVHVDSWRRSFAGIVPANFLSEMSVEKRLKAYSERQSNGDYSMIVAELPDEGIVGFADFGTPILAGDFDAQIFSFYFLPEFQRKGLGERLFRRCIRQLMAEEKKSLCLDSLEVSPYRNFYGKMGGKIVGRDGHKLGDEDFETVIYGWDDISSI